MQKRSLKRCVDWSLIDKTEYMEAMRLTPVNPAKIKQLISNALTDQIDDREMFMKGIIPPPTNALCYVRPY